MQMSIKYQILVYLYIYHHYVLTRGMSMTNHQRNQSRMIMVPTYVFDSASFNNLSSAAKELLMTILARYNGYNNGQLQVSWRIYKDVISCTSEHTFIKSLRELLEANLLSVTGTAPTPLSEGRPARLFALTWLNTSTNKNPLRTNWEQCPRKAEFLAKMKRQN